ncbi:MAG TPA: class I SAM-dependent methyltransferase [Blastocatellia bacterium]|jgi:SAM-dependent methyltransferase|nr:class I SAM-dependent methyltransferase [Blastocatellia bacterium]
MKEIFSNIYHHNLWGDPESASGPGSGVSRTSAFRDELSVLLKTVNARSLLDAACGDFNWMKETDLCLDHYIGVDIVPEIVAANRRKYGSSSVTFIDLDIAGDELPGVDVILCRDCLVHFSFEDTANSIRNFKRSGSTYLLTTTFIHFPANVDIRTADWRQINLEIAPFNFPKPIALIDEKCTHTGGIYADKRLALWRLGDIAP